MSVCQSSDIDKQPKVRVAVEIASGDKTIAGHIFLNPNERIIDMMNDARIYVAFEHGDGTFEVLSKAQIWRVRPVDQLSLNAIQIIPSKPST